MTSEWLIHARNNDKKSGHFFKRKNIGANVEVNYKPLNKILMRNNEGKMNKAKQRFYFGSCKIILIICIIGAIAIVAILGGYQIIGLIGVIVGVILGINQISQEILKAKKIQKEVQTQLLIGDSFSERQEYSGAIKEYEKALAFDKDNIEAHRRIITASRKKFELQRAEFSQVESQEVDDTLARIYRVYSLNSSSKEDIGLLLEEALILNLTDRFEASIFVLEKAHNLSPKNPDVLAELGYLSSSKENIEALDLIRRAIEIQPSNPRYHLYLADAEKKATFYVEAIREYNRTAMLTIDGRNLRDYPFVVLYKKNVHSVFRNLRNNSFAELQNIFFNHGLNEESLLNSELDMPLHERVQVLEYSREKGFLSFESYMYLARSYYELGDLEKATATIQSALEGECQWREREINSFHILYAMFLDEGNLDPSTPIEVPAKIGEDYYDEKLFSSYFPWKHARDYFIKKTN